MTSNSSSSESALGFCRLLREGRLFEAEAWLKAGKPSQYDHRNVRCTPVGIAIDTSSVLALNAVQEGHDTALRAALLSLEWEPDFHRDEPYSSHHTYALEALKRLLRLGARFQPEDSDELPILRRCLLRLHWFDGYELMKCFHKTAALGQHHVGMLFKHPRLRSHLRKRLPALLRLFPVLNTAAGPSITLLSI